VEANASVMVFMERYGDMTSVYAMKREKGCANIYQRKETITAYRVYALVSI
jgi:hypothetical protein